MERLKNQKDWELYKGNLELFRKVVQSENVTYLYDADGLLVDSARSVFRDFRQRTGIQVFPKDIDRWDMLTETARKNSLPESLISTAENAWFDPDTLENSPLYLYAKPTLLETMHKVGKEKNFILTSRKPYLRTATENWMRKWVPELPLGQLLIRSDDQVKETVFKAGQVAKYAEISDWVVFLDDSTKYVKAVLDSGIKNCFVINVPMGKTEVDFNHENLLVVGRHPEDLQAMYPLYTLFRKSFQGW